MASRLFHDDVIKWKQFPRYWPFVRGIHRSPVNSPHKGQSRGALLLSLICARINGWVNNPEAGDLRRHPTHCDVIVLIYKNMLQSVLCGMHSLDGQIGSAFSAIWPVDDVLISRPSLLLQGLWIMLLVLVWNEQNGRACYVGTRRSGGTFRFASMAP